MPFYHRHNFASKAWINWILHINLSSAFKSPLRLEKLYWGRGLVLVIDNGNFHIEDNDLK